MWLLVVETSGRPPPSCGRVGILDRPGYRRLHQWYLILTTIQWARAVMVTGRTIQAWRVDDTARP